MVYALLCIVVATYLLAKAKVRPTYLTVAYVLMIMKTLAVFLGLGFEKDAGTRTYQAFAQILNFNFFDTFIYPAAVNSIGILISGQDRVLEVTNCLSLFFVALIFSYVFKRKHQRVLLLLTLMPSLNYYAMTGLRDTLIYATLIIGAYFYKTRKYKWLTAILPAALMRPEIAITNFSVLVGFNFVRRLNVVYIIIFLPLIGVAAYSASVFLAYNVLGFLTNAQDLNLFELAGRVRALRFSRQFFEDGGSSAYFTPDQFASMSLAQSYLLQIWNSFFLFHGRISEVTVLLIDNLVFVLISVAAYRHGDRVAFYAGVISFLLMCFFMINYGNAFRMRIGITGCMALSLILGRR